jgi:hypothetical protein
MKDSAGIDVEQARIRGETLKFDASFIYDSMVVIIDFGPDDGFLKQNDRRSTEEEMVRASSM